MSKTIGRFTHVLYAGRETHTSPIIEIRIKRWTQDKDGHVSIASHLMTAREIAEHIDALIEDLNALPRKAKRALAPKMPN